MKRSPRTLATEEKLIAVLEREIASLQKENARLLRMVEMVMEERFYKPTITGGVRDNVQTSGLPIESLNDVATFDEDVDAAEINRENSQFAQHLQEISDEHTDWRKQKGLAEPVPSDAA